MKKLSLEQLLGILRHLLTGVGMILVTVGVLDSEATETIIGLLLSVVSVFWSVKSKKQISE